MPGLRPHPKLSVFVAGHWKCRECHGIQYKSRRMGTHVRQLFRFRELEATIAEGRPKGMHQKTYRALQAKSERLRNLTAKNGFPVPNTEVLNRCEFVWTRFDLDMSYGVGIPDIG